MRKLQIKDVEVLALLKTNATLTDTMIDFLHENSTSEDVKFAKEFVANIYKFLDENNWSIKAKEFAERAIDALMKGGEVDFEDRIVNNLSEKGRLVYNKLLSRTGGLSIMNSLLIAFSTDQFNEKYLFIEEVEKLINPFTGYESLKALAQTINTHSKHYTIQIKKSTLESRSELELALVLLHEFLHAKLFVHEGHEGSKSFDEIFKEYLEVDELHHEIMAKEYTMPMVNSLMRYDSNKESQNFYYILAQGNISPELRDPTITKQQIRDVITKLRNR